MNLSIVYKDIEILDTLWIKILEYIYFIKHI